MRTIHGDLAKAANYQFAIVVSRFNEMICQQLLQGATHRLTEQGITADAITVVHVPGAYELPLAAKRCAETGKYNAVVCLGAVVRGGTPHFDYVAGEAAAGVMRSSLESGVPIAFGVLTCDDIEQAMDRAGGKMGNKGAEAVDAAMEMADIMHQLRSLSRTS